jgi:UDP-N-acetylmuramyl pentapeptide phosphotransferase/UDP-N-acetylglucosamine-1-phosphate transferase
MQTSVIFGIALDAMFASFAAGLLIILTQGWHGRLSLDTELVGAQKFHKKPVPRVGGIALLIGMAAALIFSPTAPGQRADASMLLLAGMPAFAAGLIEDVTKNASVRGRLLATFGSALLACWLLDACLPRLDVWGLDNLLYLMPLAAIIVTAIAVAGVANAINIIDGFHGVAGSAVVIILAGMGFLAWRSGDVFVTHLAVIGAGATIGFLLINYPTGRLFLGDGGAYLLGFWVAEVAVLLILRNPAINAWQVLAICSYPVIEVLYSIYRKKVIRKISPGIPDRLHLHMLIYRRVVCQLVPRNDQQPWIRNAGVACILAAWIAAMTLMAVWVGDTVAAAVTVVIANVLLYLAVYTRLVRGRWNFNTGFVPRFRADAPAREMR